MYECNHIIDKVLKTKYGVKESKTKKEGVLE